jgi:hypothetical protein
MMTKTTAGKLPAKSAAKSAAKPSAKPALARAAVKAVAKPAVMPAVAKAAARPSAKPAAKPAVQPAPKPAMKRGTRAKIAAPTESTLVHPRSVATIPPSESDDVPEQVFAEGAQDQIDPDLRYRMISDVAYRRYVERGYADGGDMDDWLQAEAEVDHVLANRGRGTNDGG